MIPEKDNVDILEYWVDDFPICVLPDSHFYVPWHVHDFYELVLVVEGFCFHHIQDTVSLIMEGDLLLLKPGVCHQYSGTRECKLINCVFERNALVDVTMNKLIQLPEMGRFDPDSEETFHPIHLDIKQRESFHAGLEQIGKEYDKKEIGWQLKMEILLSNILVDYARCYNDYKLRWTTEKRRSAYMNHAIKYIAEHYTEPLTVQELAAIVGVSPDHLSRKFRMMTGVAVNDYIQRYRISRSLGYLQEEYTIGEVAKKCGFNSIAYFSRLFKKEMEMSPTLYRQKLRNKA